MELVATAPPRQPFRVTQLPLLARCYRNAFRSGRLESLSPVARFLSRAAFYFLLRCTQHPVRGEMTVQLPAGGRRVSFNARNRQFNSLYFEKYALAYEPEVSVLVDQVVPDDGIFYDVGANWGYFSIYLASRPGFRGHIHSFEPWPTTFTDLDELVRALELTAMIACHPLALGDHAGRAQMKFGSHSGLAQLCPTSKGHAVELATLDGLGLPAPDLIKLDVEGHEQAVLSGAHALLDRARPALVFENAAVAGKAGAASAVLLYLEKLGYQLTVPQLICRDRGTGAEVEAGGYFDPRALEYLRLECRPFRAAARRELRSYLNIFAYHRDSPPAFLHANA